MGSSTLPCQVVAGDGGNGVVAFRAKNHPLRWPEAARWRRRAVIIIEAAEVRLTARRGLPRTISGARGHGWARHVRSRRQRSVNPVAAGTPIFDEDTGDCDRHGRARPQFLAPRWPRRQSTSTARPLSSRPPPAEKASRASHATAFELKVMATLASSAFDVAEPRSSRRSAARGRRSPTTRSPR